MLTSRLRTILKSLRRLVVGKRPGTGSRRGRWPALSIENLEGRIVPAAVLDPTFGSGGLAVVQDFNHSDLANAVAIQANGNIVVAGENATPVYDTTTQLFDQIASPNFALARYTSTGALDMTFGSNGMAVLHTGSDSEATSVALEADGSMVAAGYSAGQFFLARFNASGVLDATFGTAGTVTTTIGTAARINALAIQPGTGDLVVAGTATIGGVNEFAVAIYSPGGALLSETNTAIGTSASASSLAFQTNGDIVVAGTAIVSGSSDIALARYTATGALDTGSGFGTGGIVTTAPPSGYASVVANGVAVDGNNNIVVAGGATTPVNATNFSSEEDFVLARYTPSGVLDASFGTSHNGVVTTNFGQTNSFVEEYAAEASAVVIRADGSIVAGGTVTELFYLDFINPDNFGESSSYSAFALAEYDTVGNLVSSFGNNGTTTTPSYLNPSNGGAYYGANALAVQGDGDVVAAGYSVVVGDQITVSPGSKSRWRGMSP